jgi:hypothetical protein
MSNANQELLLISLSLAVLRLEMAQAKLANILND